MIDPDRLAQIRQRFSTSMNYTPAQAAVQADVDYLLAALTEAQRTIAQLRDAAGPAFEILEGLRLSVKWEVAPSIMLLIEKAAPALLEALERSKEPI